MQLAVVPASADFSFGSLGFTVTNLNSALAEELGLDVNATGVVVREVTRQPGGRQGLTLVIFCSDMANGQLMMLQALQQISKKQKKQVDRAFFVDRTRRAGTFHSN